MPLSDEILKTFAISRLVTAFLVTGENVDVAIVATDYLISSLRHTYRLTLPQEALIFPKIGSGLGSGNTKQTNNVEN